MDYRFPQTEIGDLLAIHPSDRDSFALGPCHKLEIYTVSIHVTVVLLLLRAGGAQYV
jgi:hypothetical protein